MTSIPPRDPSDPPSDLPPADVEELVEGEVDAESVTGRASRTDDRLDTLFGNETSEHLADGFEGTSGDDPQDRAAERGGDD